MIIKRVMVLQGAQNSGKTTILKELIRNINNKKIFNMILHNRCYNHCINTEHSDVWVVYKYKNKIVAIITVGDGVSITKEKLREIEEKYNNLFMKEIVIDLLVCASHTTKNYEVYFNNIVEQFRDIKKINTQTNIREIMDKINNIIKKQ